MAVRTTHKGKRSRCSDVLHRPRGLFHSRVQQVGPEHFGIVAVDCAKARSKWMLADFYGKVLVPPTVVNHNRTDLDGLVAAIRQAQATFALQDLVVAVERTGRYHLPVQRACRAAGWDTRVVHPFATKSFRQPADPAIKTDDVDLAALFRAAVNGFALTEAVLAEDWQTLQLVCRHRRDLVTKAAQLKCQIQEHLNAAWPGYAACFEDLWESNISFSLLRLFDTPAALVQAGLAGIIHALRTQEIRFRRHTLEKILVWAGQAAGGAMAAACYRRLALAYQDDHTRKLAEIEGLERESAARLAGTPYLLLLSVPGINVVSAADLAAELGPIAHYANARCVLGRAGLRPSRYQSDQVDLCNGPLVRSCNRRLRAAIMRIAENLIVCNHHFRALATTWQAAGKDARDIRVRVAHRFCRIAYQLVAGGQVFAHPAVQGRHYILDKLTIFHREHETPMPQVLADLQTAVGQLPRAEHAAEARPLAEELDRIESGRCRGP